MKVRFRLPNKGTSEKPRYDQHSPIYIRFGSALTPSGYLVDKDHWQTPKAPTKIEIAKAKAKAKTTLISNPRLKRPNFEQGLKNNFEPLELSEDEEKKGFKALSDSTLSAITTFILEQEEKTPKNVKRDSKWLKSVMDKHHGKNDSDVNTNLFRTNLGSYLDKLDFKKDIYRKGIHPTLKRFLAYEKSIKKDLTNEEIETDFSELYGKWMINLGNMPSYVKMDFRHFKNALKLASKLGYKTFPKDWKSPEDKNKPKPVTLTWDDIDLLYNHKFESKSLENIRATLLISCYTALRYSDVYKVKSELINKDRLKIKVKKTGGEVMLPIHRRVKQILKDVEIYEISLSYFDRKVKRVCELVGITDKVFGRKRYKGTEAIELPKWQFASSHIGRRSFATNHYGKLPTPIIMACTGHATETMFLRYIGEVDDKHVDIMLDYWDKLDEERNA